jgi:hypothetical protein
MHELAIFEAVSSVRIGFVVILAFVLIEISIIIKKDNILFI